MSTFFILSKQMQLHVSFFLLQAPSLDEKVILHFIALVNVGGTIYELGKYVLVYKISEIT